MMIKAITEISERAHAGQLDKAGQPYFEHPKRVLVILADVLFEMGLELDEDLAVGAIAHDLVEDSEITMDDLRSMGVSERSLNILNTITRKPEESYNAYLRRVAGDRDSAFVKMADAMDNSDENRIALLSEEQRERTAKKYGGVVKKMLKSLEAHELDGLAKSGGPVSDAVFRSRSEKDRFYTILDALSKPGTSYTA